MVGYRPARWKIDVVGRRQGAHPVGLDELDNSRSDGTKFFCLRRRRRRSVQLRASIPPTPRNAPRRQKKVDISLQSRGRICSDKVAACGKRILFSSAIQPCYSEFQWMNFEIMSLVAQLARPRAFARISQWSPQGASSGRIFDATLLVWYYLMCLRSLPTMRVAMGASAAYGHSLFVSVWDRKKGRDTPTALLVRTRKISDVSTHAPQLPRR